MAKGGGGGTTVQTSEPWAEQKPHLINLFNKANDAFSATPKQGYTGDFIAAPSGEQNLAMDLGTQLAFANFGMGDKTGALADFFSSGVTGGKYTAPGDWAFTDLGTPEELNAAIEASIQPAKRTLMEQILPGLESKAISGGAYGGSKYQELQGRALHDFSTEAGNIAAELGYTDYDKRRDLSFQDLTNRRAIMPALFDAEARAAGLIPSLTESGYKLNAMPLDTLAQVGGQRQAVTQDQLDNERMKVEAAQDAPWIGLDRLNSLITGNYGGTSTSTAPKGSSLMNALQGGFGGYALGSAATGSALSSALGLGSTALGPWGAVAGGLAGLFL